MTWSRYYVSVYIYYPQPPDLPHSRDDPRRTEEVGPIQGVNAIYLFSRSFKKLRATTLRRVMLIVANMN